MTIQNISLYPDALLGLSSQKMQNVSINKSASFDNVFSGVQMDGEEQTNIAKPFSSEKGVIGESPLLNLNEASDSNQINSGAQVNSSLKGLLASVLVPKAKNSGVVEFRNMDAVNNLNLEFVPNNTTTVKSNLFKMMDASIKGTDGLSVSDDRGALNGDVLSSGVKNNSKGIDNRRVISLVGNLISRTYGDLDVEEFLSNNQVAAEKDSSPGLLVKDAAESLSIDVANKKVKGGGQSSGKDQGVDWKQLEGSANRLEVERGNDVVGVGQREVENKAISLTQIRISAGSVEAGINDSVANTGDEKNISVNKVTAGVQVKGALGGQDIDEGNAVAGVGRGRVENKVINWMQGKYVSGVLGLRTSNAVTGGKEGAQSNKAASAQIKVVSGSLEIAQENAAVRQDSGFNQVSDRTQLKGTTEHLEGARNHPVVGDLLGDVVNEVVSLANIKGFTGSLEAVPGKASAADDGQGSGVGEVAAWEPVKGVGGSLEGLKGNTVVGDGQGATGAQINQVADGFEGARGNAVAGDAQDGVNELVNFAKIKDFTGSLEVVQVKGADDGQGGRVSGVANWAQVKGVAGSLEESQGNAVVGDGQGTTGTQIKGVAGSFEGSRGNAVTGSIQDGGVNNKITNLVEMNGVAGNFETKINVGDDGGTGSSLAGANQSTELNLADVLMQVKEPSSGSGAVACSDANNGQTIGVNKLMKSKVAVDATSSGIGTDMLEASQDNGNKIDQVSQMNGLKGGDGSKTGSVEVAVTQDKVALTAGSSSFNAVELAAYGEVVTPDDSVNLATLTNNRTNGNGQSLLNFVQGNVNNALTTASVAPDATSSVDSQQQLRQLIFQQIAARVNWMTQKDITQIKMVLKPENLGTIVMQVSHQQNVLSATIQASDSRVTDLLKSQIGVLKTSLAQDGIHLQNISVFVGGNFNPNSGSGQQWQNFNSQMTSDSNLASKVDTDIVADSLRMSDYRNNSLVDMLA